MDILDQILDAQKGSRDEKVENFKSLFAEEDNVAVKSALAKAKQVEENCSIARRVYDETLHQCFRCL